MPQNKKWTAKLKELSVVFWRTLSYITVVLTFTGGLVAYFF